MLLLAACCAQVVSAADAQPPADSKAAGLKPEPKNIEEEYYTVPVRSVLGEGPHQPLSTGKILNQLGEFEIVNEGPGDATGDINATTPLFSECSPALSAGGHHSSCRVVRCSLVLSAVVSQHSSCRVADASHT